MFAKGLFGIARHEHHPRTGTIFERLADPCWAVLSELDHVGHKDIDPHPRVFEQLKGRFRVFRLENGMALQPKRSCRKGADRRFILNQKDDPVIRA